MTLMKIGSIGLVLAGVLGLILDAPMWVGVGALGVGGVLFFMDKYR